VKSKEEGRREERLRPRPKGLLSSKGQRGEGKAEA